MTLFDIYITGLCSLGWILLFIMYILYRDEKRCNERLIRYLEKCDKDWVNDPLGV